MPPAKKPAAKKAPAKKTVAKKPAAKKAPAKKTIAKKPAAKKAPAKKTIPKKPAAKKAPAKKAGLKAAHFARLDKAIKQYKCLGSMLIVGINGTEASDDEDEDEDDDDDKECSAEEIARLRHVLINASRDKALSSAMKFASCGGGFMFGTNEGNLVCEGIPVEVQKALKKKSMPERFDALFALTHSILSFDYWIHDNECWEPGQELEMAMHSLAKAWRETLARSDSELGIDSEFTRPGVVALCEQLEDAFSGSEAACEFEFNWRAA
jgi:hypothetical protein